MQNEKQFSDVSIQLLSASVFRACPDTPNSESVKNQYHYRLMLMYQGEATLVCDGTETAFPHNSILFLPPNCPYRILNTHGNFTLLNLWFTFFPEENADRIPCETQNEKDFSQQNCAPRYHFTDAPSLNRAFLWMPGKYTAASFLKIYNELSGAKPFYLQRASAELFLFLCDTVRMQKSVSEPQEDQSASEKRLASILHYIHTHITDKLDCAELSERFHCHPNHLNRLIKAETGSSVKQYILSEKLKYAHRLRAETTMTMSEIAQYLGFFDYSHFAKYYKKSLEEDQN